MDIEGKVVIVTGAGSGLGAELARGFARAGAHVVIADLDGRAAGEVAAQIERDGGSCSTRPVDVRVDEACAALVTDAESIGGPHVLVNNAGGWSSGAHQYPDAPVARWSATIDLNLRAPMLLTQLCLDPMRRAGGGVVVNVASSAGAETSAYGSPEYGATKAALIRFTTCLADLPGTHQVRVACVVPNWIGLPRAHRELAAMSPTERAAAPPLIPPERVVDTAFDLVRDDDASGSVVEL